ncbi:hypothetical protein CYMTET_19108 [Cymbomonas tetramitiformis]|uniref:Major facilitator superfamily associated domain-containing protein n=1 Tax=Cymbomonas tetramitiformis TaxID=36881 RepID=A0AAE0G7Z5_9CHLO|nr:hypothetical protein CYMTET_19108 [Cymbomonas tetramitiformis]
MKPLSEKVKVSILFFVEFTWLACPGRFFSIFLQSYGLSNSQVGVLLSLPSLFAIISTPLWTALSDVLGDKRLVLLIIVPCSITLFALFQLPDVLWEGNLLTTHRFAWMFIIRSLLITFMSPIFSVIDTIALECLGSQKDRYGQCRLWGAVSWGLSSAFVIGPLLDVPSFHITTVFLIGNAITGIALLAVVYFMLPKPPTVSEEDSEGHETELQELLVESEEAENAGDLDKSSEHLVKLKHPDGIKEIDPASLLCDSALKDEQVEPKQSAVAVPEKAAVSPATRKFDLGDLGRLVVADGAASIVFFLNIFCLAIGSSVVENLIFLFFQEDLGATNTLCGISVLITVIFEIPIFQYSHKLLEILGTSKMMSVANFAYVVRTVGYTVFTNPWLVLLVEPMHGVTYGCKQSASVLYVSELAPKGEDYPPVWDHAIWLAPSWPGCTPVWKHGTLQPPTSVARPFSPGASNISGAAI